MNDERLVVVADDERDIVELVAIVLGRAGYEVITASDGQRALELIHEHRPALCVLDGRMPGLAGWEILQRLREDPAATHTKILILTATIDDEREIRRHGVSSDGFMTKPFEADALLDEVERLLAA